jgi:hypothetical protein
VHWRIQRLHYCLRSNGLRSAFVYVCVFGVSVCVCIYACACICVRW